MMIGAEVLPSQTCRKEQTQTITLRCFSTCCLLCSKSPKLEGETSKQTKSYPANVICKYVFLHNGGFKALNLSVGSYIKHSLYSSLPLIFIYLLSQEQIQVYTIAQPGFGATLFMNQNAKLVASGSTFCIHATVPQDSYHTSDMILYLHCSQTLKNRREKQQKKKHNARKPTQKSSCSIFTKRANCKEALFQTMPSVSL